MERYNGVEPDPEGAFVYYDDAQRALDDLKAQLEALRQERDEARHSRDVFKSQMIAHMNDRDSYAEDLTTLQAQAKQLDRTLADVYQQRDGLQAQLRQVEHDAETYRKMHTVCTMNLALANNELTTLRQLVEALPVVDGRMDVECGACYYIRSFVAGQYGIVCGLMTEQSTAMAIKTLLEYRAVLAAQDAGKEDVSHD